MAGYKIGELLVSSKPYAYVLGNEYRGKFCDYCMKEKVDLKRCSQCAFLYFCDKSCQKKAWEVHKDECKYIKKADKKKPTQSLRLISLIIFKLKKYGYEEPFEKVHNKKISFSSLMSHVDDIKKDIKRCQIMMALVITLKEYIGAENVPSSDKFTEIFGKVCINTFTIDHEGRGIGSGLYLGGSVFDHSCDLDAVVVFDGPILNVRTIRNIPHRDISKVYISYIDNLLLTEERKEKLREQYYFTCQCVLCTTFKQDEAMTKLLDSNQETKCLAQKCKEDFNKIEEMMNDHEDPATIHEYCMNALEIQHKILANTNICKVKTMSAAFEMCIQLQLFKDALMIGALLDEPLRLYYGENHDLLGLHLFKLGKILHFMELSAAVPKLVEAEKILRITHGEQHYLFKDLQTLLLEARLVSAHHSNHLLH